MSKILPALAISTIVILSPIIFIVGKGCQWAGAAVNTIYNEISPQELLRKYVWFKDAYAKINAFDSNLSAYEYTLESTKKTYGETANWPVDVRKDISLQQREINGILSMRNNLAAEYNAAMAKINWRFTNIGGLPMGASEVLPREVIEYRLK